MVIFGCPSYDGRGVSQGRTSKKFDITVSDWTLAGRPYDTVIRCGNHFFRIHQEHVDAFSQIISSLRVDQNTGEEYLIGDEASPYFSSVLDYIYTGSIPLLDAWDDDLKTGSDYLIAITELYRLAEKYRVLQLPDYLRLMFARAIALPNVATEVLDTLQQSKTFLDWEAAATNTKESQRTEYPEAFVNDVIDTLETTVAGEDSNTSSASGCSGPTTVGTATPATTASIHEAAGPNPNVNGATANSTSNYCATKSALDELPKTNCRPSMIPLWAYYDHNSMAPKHLVGQYPSSAQFSQGSTDNPVRPPVCLPEYFPFEAPGTQDYTVTGSQPSVCFPDNCSSSASVVQGFPGRAVHSKTYLQELLPDPAAFNQGLTGSTVQPKEHLPECVASSAKFDNAFTLKENALVSPEKLKQEDREDKLKPFDLAAVQESIEALQRKIGVTTHAPPVCQAKDVDIKKGFAAVDPIGSESNAPVNRGSKIVFTTPPLHSAATVHEKLHKGRSEKVSMFCNGQSAHEVEALRIAPNASKAGPSIHYPSPNLHYSATAGKTKKTGDIKQELSTLFEER